MNDKDIIQLYLNRDQRALSATAKKYGKYCTSIAKNILGNQEDGRIGGGSFRWCSREACSGL